MEESMDYARTEFLAKDMSGRAKKKRDAIFSPRTLPNAGPFVGGNIAGTDAANSVGT